MSLSRNRILQYAVIAMAIWQVLAAFTIGGTLASAAEGGGTPTGIEAIADAYPNKFTPADWAFTIWAPIYAGLLLFSYFQAKPQRTDDPLLVPLRLPMVVAMFFTGLWVPLNINDNQALSMIAMLFILASLALAFVNFTRLPRKLTRAEWWQVVWPISLFFGWITIATVANAVITLLYLGWDGGGLDDATWSTLLIIVATVIVLAVLVTNKGNIIYGLVPVWAFAAIAENYGEPVATPALAMAGLILVALLALNWSKLLRRDAHEPQAGDAMNQATAPTG